MKIVKCLVLAFCVVYVSCATTRLESLEHRSLDTGRSEDGTDFSSGFKILVRAYDQCETSKDTFTCLKAKALRFVDRALNIENIPIVDGLAVVKTEDAEATPTDARALSDDDVEDPTTIDGLLVDRVSRFVSTHSLQLNMPKIAENARDILGDEGRGSKLKKMMGPLLMGLMMKGGMVALAFKAVALLAGKALMVAKIALVLAAVIGLAKLAGGKGGGKVSYEIVKHPHVSHAHSHSSSVVHEPHGGWESGGGGGGGGGGGHGGWESGGGGGGGHYRSFDTAETEFVPHAMAYRGQISQQQVASGETKQ